jgi:hypothetical protein
MWMIDDERTDSGSDVEDKSSQILFASPLEALPRARPKPQVRPFALALADAKRGVMLYGTVPPPKKFTQTLVKIQDAVDRVVNDIKEFSQPPDAIIVYDIQDEPSRDGSSRPFPYLETQEPRMYAQMLFEKTNLPPIVYRALRPAETEEDFQTWANDSTTHPYNMANFVMVGSRESKVTVPDACKVMKQSCRNSVIGGILIAERHRDRSDEVKRVYDKTCQGTSFFTSQVVYNADNAIW